MTTGTQLARRRFFTAFGLAAGSSVLRSAEAGGIASITKEVVKVPSLPKGTWFHPRACRVGSKILMTTQPIMGSDHFGQVHWTVTEDLGRTWSGFTPAPPFGWEPLADGTNEASDTNDADDDRGGSPDRETGRVDA